MTDRDVNKISMFSYNEFLLLSEIISELNIRHELHTIDWFKKNYN